MGAITGPLQHLVQLDAVGRITAVVVEGQVIAEHRLHLVHIGGLFRRFGAIMQMHIAAGGLQVAAHGQHWRDADAAGDQQMRRGIIGQRKIVAGTLDGQHVADRNLIVHMLGAAGAVFFAQYGGHIFAEVGRIAGQGIGIMQMRVEHKDQMRTGLPFGQIAAILGYKFEFLDARRQLLDIGDFELHFGLSSLRWRSRFRMRA